MGSVTERLAQWQRAQALGKKPSTRKFHAEVVTTIKAHWSNCDQPVESVTDQELLEFAQKVDHYCPSRWNLIVTILRTVTDRGAVLRYRKRRFRDFTPPDEKALRKFLRECDRLPRSMAGLSVRLLTLTGLRICEARNLRWDHVHKDRITVPVSKNGRARTLPLIPGLRPVLKRLRDAAGSKETVLPHRHFRKGLQRACDRAGMKELTYHCFRHIFATRCIESGVDIPTVARWLGHQDGGALLSEMYFHLLDGHSLRMARRVRIRL